MTDVMMASRPARHALLMSLTILALGAQDIVPSRIDAVRVHPDRAEVSRIAELALPQGRSRVVVGGLPSCAQAESLRCHITAGNARVLDQELSPAPAPTATDDDAELARLDAALLPIEDALLAVAERRRVRGALQQRTAMALGTALDGEAPDPAALAAEWDAALALLGDEALTLATRQRDLEMQAHALRGQQEEIKIRAALRATPVTGQHVVLWLDCAAAGAVTVTLSYGVDAEVRWGPCYRVALDRGSSQAVLEAMIAVSQRSGEDWNSVALDFSTRIGGHGLRPPALPGLVLSANHEGQVVRPLTLALPEPTVAPPPVRGREEAGLADVPPRQGPSLLTASSPISGWAQEGIQAVVGSLDDLHYVPAMRGTITGDGRQASIPLGTWTCACPWHLECVPEQVPAVYVRGSLTNTSGVILLAGSGEAWLDGRYIGPTAFPGAAIDGMAECAFGTVDTLTVHRQAEPMRSMTTNDGTGSAYRYEISVTLANRGDEAANVRVLEAVPVSAVARVAIVVEDGTSPFQDLGQGLLAWTVPLAPGAGHRLLLRYRITIAGE